MARILFAWECGGGIGHLTRYSDLIDRLIADRLCLFRKMGLYPQREAANYLGTSYSTAGESPIWPAGQGSKVFAYLKHHQDLEELLTHIQQLGVPTLIKGDPMNVSATFLRSPLI